MLKRLGAIMGIASAGYTGLKQVHKQEWQVHKSPLEEKREIKAKAKAKAAKKARRRNRK